MNQLYFLHIPKTAGSFINYSISEELNKHNILNYSHEVLSNFPHNIDFDNTSFLGGHFAASPLAFNPNFYVACILRDPLERSISYFNFVYHIYTKKYKDKKYGEKLPKTTVSPILIFPLSTASICCSIFRKVLFPTPFFPIIPIRSPLLKL